MGLQQRHGEVLWRQMMWRRRAWAARAARGAHPHRAQAASLWSMGCRSAIAPLEMVMYNVKALQGKPSRSASIQLASL